MQTVKQRLGDAAYAAMWSHQEFAVFDGDVLVGRILRSQSASPDRPWLWAITSRPPGGADQQGYARSLEAALAELTSQWEAAGSAGK